VKLTYRLVRDANGYLAECVESEAAGEGRTASEAVASLRKALEERLFRPDAVAPPSREPQATIELSLANDEREERRSLDLGGPGEPPRSP